MIGKVETKHQFYKKWTKYIYDYLEKDHSNYSFSNER